VQYNSTRILRGIGFVILALGVGFAGVYVGGAIRSRRAPAPVVANAPEYPFEVGAPFPDVAVIDSSGASWQTMDLIAGRGAVVLFVDLECESCAIMCQRWEDAIQQGSIAVDRVVGIAHEEQGAVNDFRADKQLTFAFYRDAGRVFLHEHGVARYPLEVVVGLSGTVRFRSYDSVSPIDASAVVQQMLE